MKFTDTLKELEAKATDGPWGATEWQDPQWAVIGPNSAFEFIVTTSQENDKQNAELIAFFRNHAKEIINLVVAAENMRDCKGRYHTEQATTRVFEALAALNKEQSNG